MALLLGACGAGQQTTTTGATLPPMMASQLHLGEQLQQQQPQQQSQPPVPTQPPAVGTVGAVDRINAAFATGQFPTMLWMLTASGVLDEIGTKPVTILAPDEQAFRNFAVVDFYGLLQNPQALAPVLRRHVVEGVYTYDQLASIGSVTNLAGEHLAVWTNGRMVEVNYTTVSPLAAADEEVVSEAVSAGTDVALLAADRLMLVPPGTG